MKALIDGDVLVYAGGFASDAAAKKAVIAEMGLSTPLDEQGKARLQARIDAMGPIHEPLAYCLNGVRTMIDNIVKTAEADTFQIIVSHPVNFREQIYEPYKANRNTAHKPFWYAEIQDYLFERGAVYSNEGDEADDALGIGLYSATEPTILCSIDKDLDQVPGLHYNWSKLRREEGVYTISPLEGDQFFYQQLLTGDSTDNIPGMFKKLGKKAMPKILAPLSAMFHPRDMYDYVMSIYNGDTEFVHMIAQLLWIKRSDERWTVPA